MNDPQGSPLSPPPARRSKAIALSGLLLGAVVMLTGLVLTVFYAYLVWNKVNASTGAPDEQEKDAMISFFTSMNHLAKAAVVMTLCGLAAVTASMLALSRKKK
jgi:ABC-type Fe3+ transport system permease subunit